MLELADIFRVVGAGYRDRHAGTLRPEQTRAMHAIVRCRTPALGGSLYQCDACGTLDYAYHSCRNRHCPKCQDEREQAWLTAVRARMLPCDHYLLTFTLPQELRALAQAEPRRVYSALLREAAATVRTLAANSEWVGGEVGILAVLHTWTRTLEYHPHAHLLVTAGGLAPDQTTWIKPAHPRFLMPGYMLSEIFRAKMRDALGRGQLTTLPPVWDRPWTVHVQQIGRGEHALRYLARYVFHVAITNRRLEHFANGHVTFRYVHARTGETRRLTLPVDRFISRFLMHVLPRGFTKIRYYGLLSPSAHPRRDTARHVLESHAPSPSSVRALVSPDASALPSITPDITPDIPAPRHCPHCHGVLRLVAAILPSRGPPPRPRRAPPSPFYRSDAFARLVS